MKIRQDESGQVLILTVLCMTVIMGFMALAVDVGVLFRAKRNLQIAADAAATAGALDFLYNNSSATAVVAATAAAARNGVSSGVTVNCPPKNGYHQTTGYVEVIINQPNPTYFMAMINSAFSSLPVAARAVAGVPGPSQGCVYVLDPSASGAMTLQGSFDVSASHCNVIVDSNSSNALQFTGASGTLDAGSIGVVGGAGGQTGDSTPAPVTGIAPVSDPLRITGPSVPSGCTHTSTATSVTNGATEASEGGVICFTKGVTFSNVTLAPATYVFENGVTLSGAVSTAAGGATLDLVGGSLGVNTGTTLNLVAPTSTASGFVTGINGIVLMEPPSNSSQLTFQKGNASGSLTGIIYAPSAQFYMQDSGGDKSGGLSLTTDLVVGQLFDKTATLTITSYSAVNPFTTPLRAASLVE